MSYYTIEENGEVRHIHIRRRSGPFAYLALFCVSVIGIGSALSYGSGWWDDFKKVYGIDTRSEAELLAAPSIPENPQDVIDRDVDRRWRDKFDTNNRKYKLPSRPQR